MRIAQSTIHSLVLVGFQKLKVYQKALTQQNKFGVPLYPPRRRGSATGATQIRQPCTKVACISVFQLSATFIPTKTIFTYVPFVCTLVRSVSQHFGLQRQQIGAQRDAAEQSESPAQKIETICLLNNIKYIFTNIVFHQFCF